MEVVVAPCCSVVELRQYTLRPGQREILVELFDRELVEPQEAVGMELLGQFRDLDRPDRFVWLRGFPDMESRRRSLEAFYGGPVWRANAAAANATMVDVDDVLLLRPAAPSSRFGALPPRPAASGDHAPAVTLLATICPLDRPADAAELERILIPRLAAAATPALALLVEEPSENTYPALPVRAGEHVVVWFQRSPDAAGERASIDAAADLARDVLAHMVGPPVQLRLDPTPRSRLR